MSSEPIRDPASDQLLTPENAAFIIIDYQPVQQLQDVLGAFPTYDRTTINSWEDVEFRKAVETTGRQKLIMTALWTEACLTFPALDAIREGYEVYVVVDAVGGTSLAAHEAALRRMDQAGVKLISRVQLYCELQRDWARENTIPGFMDVFNNYDGFNVEAAKHDAA